VAKITTANIPSGVRTAATWRNYAKQLITRQNARAENHRRLGGLVQLKVSILKMTQNIASPPKSNDPFALLFSKFQWLDRF
jgi:hypothetical protein